MKKKLLLMCLLLLSVMTLMAEEYVDPQTKVAYAYEPEQANAIVKAGSSTARQSEDGMLYVETIPGNPDVTGDITILESFTVDGRKYTVTGIGEYAFYFCGKITSVDIPASVTSIGRKAFSDCYSLTSVNMPENLMEMGDAAFSSCSALVSIVIPQGISRIEDNTFWSCTCLENVEFPESLTYIGVGAFFCCSSLTEIQLPEGVSTIAYAAFESSQLKSITIPASVSELESEAFFIQSLTSVTSLIEDPYPMDAFGVSAFQMGIYSKATLYVPKGCIEKYKAVSKWNAFSRIEEIESGTNLKEVKYNKSSSAVYNLQGQRVESVPRKGVYIQRNESFDSYF